MTSSQTRTGSYSSTYVGVIHVTRRLQADLFNIVDTYGQISETYARNLIGDLRILLDEEVLDSVRLLWTRRNSNDVTFAYNYDVLDGVTGLVDERSGGIRYRSGLLECDFGVRIFYNRRWYDDLSDDERREITDRCHFPWGPGASLSYSNGGFSNDRTYAKDDYGLRRSSYGA